MRNPERSFHWIVSVLEKHGVPFVVTGGLAAKSYGAERPVNDIDLDIRNADFVKIINDVKPYIVYGPARYSDEKWDLFLVTLNHEGQEIDLGGRDDTRIFDEKNKAWFTAATDFSRVEQREVFGLTVPVEDPVQLVTYKSLLNGDHQLIDIAAVSSFLRRREQG